MYRSTYSWPRHCFEVSGQLHAPSALPPVERDPCTNWVWGWACHRTALDDVESRKILPPLGLELQPFDLPIRIHNKSYDIAMHRSITTRSLHETHIEFYHIYEKEVKLVLRTRMITCGPSVICSRCMHRNVILANLRITFSLMSVCCWRKFGARRYKYILLYSV
jgi:hypothetical protein